MASFSWLHLTDLHWGMPGQSHLWPNIREVFFKDLERLHDKCGPWDALLFSGDFVQKGSAAEFESLNALVLKPLRDSLKRMGSSPVFLAVPGNHDLVRPVKTATVRVLINEIEFNNIAEEFWEKSDCEYRTVINDSFQDYTNWWTGQEFLQDTVNVQHGLLPGDFSASIRTEDGIKIGILGLNTTFLQLTDDDLQGKLALDARQFHYACSGDGVQWAQQHQACLLMTHHGPEWLRESSRKTLSTEINPAGRFAVHLFGHMHENVVRSSSTGGSPIIRLWQGCSLFGMESSLLKRRHGYSAGRLEFGISTAYIRHWPRLALSKTDGWKFEPDREGCSLEEDEGIAPEAIKYEIGETRNIANWDTIPGTGDSSTEFHGFPRPPVPYYVHPYPLQKNFTGRLQERTLLTTWLNQKDEPLLTISAIGGMGKSALVWVWLIRDIASKQPLPQDTFCPAGIFWWSFYEREASFENFLTEVLRYVSEGKLKEKTLRHWPVVDKVKTLINKLREKKFLLVLDGFERELRAYASTSAAYISDEAVGKLSKEHRECINPHASDFLRRLGSIRDASKILLTTRLLPRELDEDLEGSRVEVLKGMKEDDVVEFFKLNKIKGNRSEIISATEPYGFHALAVRLLVGVILKDKSNPRDIRVAARYPILSELKGKEKHHILQVAYNSLEVGTQLLLSQIAAFRTPMSYEMVQIFDLTNSKWMLFDYALNELIDRGLLFTTPENSSFDLHPVVRQYAYDRLINKQEVAHKVRGYFEQAPLPGDDQIEALDDLAQVMELYHHTVCAGYLDQAYRLYRDRLERWIRHFGAYHKSVELLNALCENEQKWPQLEASRDKSGMVGTLADAYAKSGQPTEAIRLYKIKVAIDKSRSKASEIASASSNLAAEQIKIGELGAANNTLRQIIKASQKSQDDKVIGLSMLRLGNLLAITGDYATGKSFISSAQKVFSSIRDELGKCQVLCVKGQCWLIQFNPREAINCLRNAHQHAMKIGDEEQTIQTAYLLGLAILENPVGKHQRKELLKEGGTLIDDALTRCHRVNLDSAEADILRVRAIWQLESGDTTGAAETANDALLISERCNYRLVKSDIHLLHVELAIREGKLDKAKEHIVKAQETALCDGKPHWYKVAMDKAQLLQDKLSTLQSEPAGMKTSKQVKEKYKPRKKQRKRSKR